MASNGKKLPGAAFAALAVFLTAAVQFAGAAEPKTASVLYFDNTAKSAELDWLGKGLSDMLSGDLAAGGGLLLVERADLEKVLREQELALSGLADPAGAPQVGRLLNARLVVYGSFLAAGPAGRAVLRVDAKAVDAESGAVVAAASAEGPESDILQLARTLSARLAAALGVPIGVPADAPANLESARAYYRGVAFLDSGDFSAAVRLFDESARFDPAFLKPGKGLEEAYRFLKDFKKQRYRREMNALAADIEALKARIGAPVFYSFGDALQAPLRFGFADAASVSAAFQARPVAWLGDTPVQAIWQLQNQYGSLGRMAEEYFQDAAFARSCGDEILRWTELAESSYPRDPFLAEVIYQRLLVVRFRDDWTVTKDVCELLMTEYPDYRMMWAVEDFYEFALDKLGN